MYACDHEKSALVKAQHEDSQGVYNGGKEPH